MEFIDELGALDREMEEALLLDPDSPESGRAARAYWLLVSRYVTEAFAIITTASNCNLLHGSNESIAHTLQQAEQDIFRGVSSLAVLLADPNIHDNLMERFQREGIIHPWHSHLGFRIRSDPKLAPKAQKFFAKQHRRGRSLPQIKQAMRLLLTQPDLQDWSS